MALASEYCIGSFNLKDFNIKKDKSYNNSNPPKDIKTVADIIISEEFDVVALQEINSRDALNELVKTLNARRGVWGFQCFYEGRFGENMPNQSGKDSERYAFIWNSRRLRLVELSKNGHNPFYFNHAGLIRPPYCIRLTPRGLLGGANFELRLINTHIVYGNSSVTASERKKERLKELRILLEKIYPSIHHKQGGTRNSELMPAYTFLLGDYNLVLNHDIENEFISRATKVKRVYKIVQEEKSTLKKGKNNSFSDTYKSENVSLVSELSEACIDMLLNSDEGINSLREMFSGVNDPILNQKFYNNNFDHFSFDKSLSNKLHLRCERVEVLGEYYKDIDNVVDRLIKYQKEVSDHVPIKLKIGFR